jgi:RNA polymerase sigma-70 factor (ECF subfamily)
LADDVLPLLFGLCHPALAVEAQAALGLRLVLGLPTAEIARLFLVSEPTMAARLTRARRKLVLAGIPFRIPERNKLDARVEGVLRAIYLAFTAGYAPGPGPEPLRVELAGEAVRLGRLLDTLLPGRTDVRALLALMTLAHARRDARVVDLDLVLLAEQDRTRWRHAEIAAGLALVVALEPTTGYAEELRLQALIAGLHAGAPSAAATDWTMIATVYERLEGLTRSPVVRLNRAVAEAEAYGPELGLALLSDLDPSSVSRHRLAAVWAELSLRAGRRAEAARWLDEAVATCPNDAERRHLKGRLDEVADRS